METLLIVNALFVWIILGLNLLLTLVLVRRMNQGEGAQQGLAKKTPAPAFSAQTLGGETVTLASYAGRAVALIFFSTSCEPCREEAPKLEALAPWARQAGVELALVSVDEVEETRRFVDEFKLTLPVLVAPQGSNTFKKDYQVPATPFYYLINARGTIQSAGYPNNPGGAWKKLADSWQATQRRMPHLATTTGG
jgi:peroxiredoxin